jgi:hypothetical protein
VTFASSLCLSWLVIPVQTVPEYRQQWEESATGRSYKDGCMRRSSRPVFLNLCKTAAR